MVWFFCNGPRPSFSETPAFKTKSHWNLAKGHPCLEVNLSQVEKEHFELAVSHLSYSNGLNLPFHICVIPTLQKKNGQQ